MRRVVALPFPDPIVRDALGFGEAVRASRTSAGLSLTDAALALGISKDTLGNLERGQGGVNLSTALRVARDLGVELLAVPISENMAAARLLNDLRARHPTQWGRSTGDSSSAGADTPVFANSPPVG